MATKVLGTPTGVFPSASELTQQFISSGGGAQSLIAPDVPANLWDGGSHVVQIEVTPQYNCYWHIEHQSIWRTDTTSWQYVQLILSLSPADENSRYQICEGQGQMHEGIIPWRTIRMSGLAKLKKGTHYYCWARANAMSGGWNYFWQGDPYLTLQGRTFGHGTF